MLKTYSVDARRIQSFAYKEITEESNPLLIRKFFPFLPAGSFSECFSG
jgi:hypothetical protein